MKILAVDVGLARTGLAVCDREERLSSPLCVVQERSMERLSEKVAATAAEQRAGEIVVGHPLNMDGSAGERAQACAAFAERLRALTRLPVRLWDERCTTVSAIGYLNQTDVRGKKRKAVVDAVAAVIILDNYLAWRKNHPDQAGV